MKRIDHFLLISSVPLWASWIFAWKRAYYLHSGRVVHHLCMYLQCILRKRFFNWCDIYSINTVAIAQLQHTDEKTWLWGAQICTKRVRGLSQIAPPQGSYLIKAAGILILVIDHQNQNPSCLMIKTIAKEHRCHPISATTCLFGHLGHWCHFCSLEEKILWQRKLLCDWRNFDPKSPMSKCLISPNESLAVTLQSIRSRQRRGGATALDSLGQS